MVSDQIAPNDSDDDHRRSGNEEKADTQLPRHLEERILALLEAGGDTASLEAEATRHPEYAGAIRRLVEAARSEHSRGDAAFTARLDYSGQQIGPYRVIRKLGEGGMGTVWLAEQVQPIQRSVALKIIKLGLDTEALVRRFALESQLLARMSHPNVATVLDAGSTRDGRPFFAMELVPGVPITTYCRELGVEARIRLFQQVCHGLHHAHSKGVIHRDIKPSNVLVVEDGGEPRPVIIDFGIAKAIEGLHPGVTFHTDQSGFVGTPGYMPPEQFAGAGADTRSDIYSLGALLYELLTGERVFESRGDDLLGLQRRIAEDTPPLPSARVARGGTSGGAKHLASALRGDLDWITLRCLEKDPERRYASARELAEELQLHLDGRPVAAGPPSFAYRLRKLLRRRRTHVMVGVALFVALLGLTTLWVGMARTAAAQERENRAEAHRLHQDAILVAFRDSTLGGLGRSPESGRRDAIGMLRRAVSLAPRSLPCGVLLCVLLNEVGDREQALAEIDRLRRSGLLHPVLAWLEAATTRAGAYTHPPVEAAASDTIELYYRARSLVTKGRRRDALPLLAQLDGHEDFGVAAAVLAGVTYMRGDREPMLAALAYAKAHALAPDNPTIVANYATTLLELYRSRPDQPVTLARARELVVAGLARHSGDGRLHYAHGLVLFNAKEFRAATEAFSRADALIPRQPAILGMLGQALLDLVGAGSDREREDLDRARRAIEQAIGIAGDPADHLRLGICLYYQGDKQKAIGKFKECRDMGNAEVKRLAEANLRALQR